MGTFDMHCATNAIVAMHDQIFLKVFGMGPALRAMRSWVSCLSGGPWKVSVGVSCATDFSTSCMLILVQC